MDFLLIFHLISYIIILLFRRKGGYLMAHECFRYYFKGPHKEFHTKNAAQRHAEWKVHSLKERWNNDEEMRKRFVSVKLTQHTDHFLVNLEFESN